MFLGFRSIRVLRILLSSSSSNLDNSFWKKKCLDFATSTSHKQKPLKQYLKKKIIHRLKYYMVNIKDSCKENWKQWSIIPILSFHRNKKTRICQLFPNLTKKERQTDSLVCNTRFAGILFHHWLAFTLFRWCLHEVGNGIEREWGFDSFLANVTLCLSVFRKGKITILNVL